MFYNFIKDNLKKHTCVYVSRIVTNEFNFNLTVSIVCEMFTIYKWNFRSHSYLQGFFKVFKSRSIRMLTVNSFKFGHTNTHRKNRQILKIYVKDTQLVHSIKMSKTAFSNRKPIYFTINAYFQNLTKQSALFLKTVSIQHNWPLHHFSFWTFHTFLRHSKINRNLFIKLSIVLAEWIAFRNQPKIKLIFNYAIRNDT